MGTLAPTEFTESALALSGPNVWPNLAADHAVDRYIFRRPEIRYHTARLRQAETRAAKLPPPLPRVVLIRFVTSRRVRGKEHTQQIGTLIHTIDHEDDLNDVRILLEEIRTYLARRMPNNPRPGYHLQLRFLDEDHKTHLASFREPWL